MTTNKADQEKEKSQEQNRYRILALYQFAPLLETSLNELKEELQNFCLSCQVRGTLIISPEGINGTICYPYTIDGGDDGGECEEEEDVVLENFESKFIGLRTRISYSSASNVFTRLRIKIKKEIVTIGINNVDPTKTVGDYVRPGREWEKLLDDPDCLVIDTRNEYEIRLGTFRNAINPNTHNFTDFPEWIRKQHNNTNDSIKEKSKIAMFCTGGIRCEKATSMMKELYPEKDIYHLEGGILAYLDTTEQDRSYFEGECFVFDQRIAVQHGLVPTEQYVPCFACRQPLSSQDRQHPSYDEGISCRYCIPTEKQKQRFLERNKQIDLADQHGTLHIHDPKYLS